MLTRIISAVILGIVFLTVCFCGLLPSTIGVTVLLVVAVIEFNRGYQRAPQPEGQPRPLALNSLLTSLGLLFPWITYASLTTHQTEQIEKTALLQGAVVLVLALRLRRAYRGEGILGTLRRSYGLVGMIYLGLLFSSFLLLRGLPGQIGRAHV